MMKYSRCSLLALSIILCGLLKAETIMFQEVAGSPFAAGASPDDVAFSPIVAGGLFAAVPDESSNQVTVFSVNQSTGFFSVVNTYPVGTLPSSVAYSPIATTGNLFAAVPNFDDNTVTIFSVNESNGTFTQVGAPVATGAGPVDIAFSPIASGNLFAAIPNSTANTVSSYLVNQTSGVFTPAPNSPFPTSARPNGIAFSPVVAGNLFAAIPNFTAGTVSIFTVNQTNGAFTLVANTLAQIGPNNVAFSPVVNGNLFLAVTNFDSDTVSVYIVTQSSGALTLVGNFPTGIEPSDVAFSPVFLGVLFAAVTNAIDNTVSLYTVNQTTGVFTPFPGSPFATQQRPDSAAFSPLTIDNLFLAVGNLNSDNVSVFEFAMPFPPVTISPPSILKACQFLNVFLTQIDVVNFIQLQAPTSGTTPVNFFVFRDAALTNLVAIVPASGSLQFFDHNRQPNVAYTYFIVSVDQFGNASMPVSVTVTERCFKEGSSS